MTGKDFRYYYTPEDFKNKVNDPLGIIPLKQIYGIYPLNEKEKGNKGFAFQIQASGWIKKNKEMEERKFYFAANDNTVLE